MKHRKRIASVICSLLVLSLAGCGTSEANVTEEETTSLTTTEATTVEMTEEETEEETEAATEDNEEKSDSAILPYDGDDLVSKYESFEVTSSSLQDGVWNDVISKTDEGSNASPELTWEPVEGATVYAIYMVDISMHYFLHWNSNGITETSLAEGWAPDSDYVGPYPPEGGTHTYDVYVIALKNPIDRLKGGVNTQTLNMQDFIDSTDTDVDGNTGNIVAIGHLSGEFTNK
ncbi:Uncharacterized conserved protein, phosphatidylethanolamine-binding protein (PEBP) family [Lachnospiraceae bacterium NE2001]|nr:Uncharacterized conserved protein, phosphatidylethanolamine-binding protein (PEBP) family [Lachnospiraceae bacterium NE2001]